MGINLGSVANQNCLSFPLLFVHFQIQYHAIHTIFLKSCFVRADGHACVSDFFCFILDLSLFFSASHKAECEGG